MRVRDESQEKGGKDTSFVEAKHIQKAIPILLPLVGGLLKNLLPKKIKK